MLRDCWAYVMIRGVCILYMYDTYKYVEIPIFAPLKARKTLIVDDVGDFVWKNKSTCTYVCLIK